MATFEESVDKAIEVAVERAVAQAVAKINAKATEVIAKIPTPNFKFVKGTAVTLTSSNKSVTYSLTITVASGKSVFLLLTGDQNPTTSKAWLNIKLYRGSTALTWQITESSVLSQNHVFSLSYIDSPSAGTYTYKAEIALGNTAYSTCLGENGNLQTPQFCVMEIH